MNTAEVPFLDWAGENVTCDRSKKVFTFEISDTDKVKPRYPGSLRTEQTKQQAMSCPFCNNGHMVLERGVYPVLFHRY